MALNFCNKTDRPDILMISHEKTIRYAQNQIAEGELLSGKSILDSVMRQLEKSSEHSYPIDI